MQPDGTDLRRIAYDGHNPTWSPDGDQLIYIRWDTAQYAHNQLWEMNTDGSHQRCILDLGTQYRSVAWSPDGTRIAGPANRGLFVYDLRTHQRQVIPWTTRGWYAPDADVRWSPDGETLAAVSVGKGPGPDDYTSDTAVFRVDPSGSATRVEGPRDLLGMDWSWSNDRLVYGSGLDTRGGSCNGDLYTVDSHGGTPELLVALDCRQVHPSWSPDGREVAFQSAGALWVVGSDGSGAHRVFANTLGGDGEGWGAPLNPSWQPRS